MRSGVIKLLLIPLAAGLTGAWAWATNPRQSVGSDEPTVGAQTVLPTSSAARSVVRDEQTDLDEQDQSYRWVWMEVTAYCPCQKCCGPQASGLTASGLPVSHNGGRFVAADTSVLPFGSRVRIPGYHDQTPVPVIDRGGAIKGSRLDVYFPSHQQALEWGRRWLLVAVVD
ncbi:MAG: hypothetical protein KatS3mg104_0318 [Phycisphaerae bacterium]|jgi:3D (Asp-Asp-Asp) domain-containing protein|nr:MAG: hypothetical protein KatS3mg104_0318 [Phycisphaerae bacterium]